MRRLRRSFSQNAFWTTCVNIAMMLTGVVTGLLLARFLGPTGRGELAAIQTWSLVLSPLAVFGMTSALVYFVGQHRARLAVYLSSSVSIIVVGCVVCVGIGYLALPYLLHAQTPDVIHAALLYLAFVPAYAVGTGVSSVFQGINCFPMWNRLRFLLIVWWLCLIVLLEIFHRLTPIQLAFYYVIGVYVWAMLVIYCVRREIKAYARPRWSAMKELLRYGAPTVASTFPQIVNFRLDQLVITAFLSAEQLGLYVVSVAWAAALQPLLTGFGMALFPRLAAEQHVEARVALAAQTVRLSFTLSVISSIAMGVLAPWVMPWVFGARFTPSVPFALMLLGSSLFANVNQVIEQCLRGFGFPGYVLVAEGSGFGLLLVGLLWSVPHWGLWGAAMSAASTSVLVCGILLYYLRRTTQCSLWRLCLFRWEDGLLLYTRIKRLIWRKRN